MDYELLTTTSIVSLLGGGLVGAILTFLANKGKTQAEAEKFKNQASESVVNAALQIADRLQVQIVQLEERVDGLDTRNKNLKSEVSGLIAQNQQMSANIEILQRENKQLHRENKLLKVKIDENNTKNK